MKRANDVLYRYQKVQVEGDLAGRQIDAFRVFMERNAQLLCSAGVTGVLVPSAFHANEGATGVRQLYLKDMALRLCYSFENRRKLFEIDSRFKFATVVAHRTGPTRSFPCAFYLHDDEWLFGGRHDRELAYSLDFVSRTGGEYLSFLELRSQNDLAASRVCFENGVAFGETYESYGFKFGRELDMTNDAGRFTRSIDVLGEGADPRDSEVSVKLLEEGYLPLHEGKTFHQFDDHWEDRPRYLINLDKIQDRSAAREGARYYRLAFRSIARSTDERTAIFTIVAPPAVFGNSAPVERSPFGRPNSIALVLVALADTFAFDWTIRLRASANINLFILNGDVLPPFGTIRVFLGHSALRLSSNHNGYEPLWDEQLGQEWREAGRPAFAWPVLDGANARWSVRAAIDAAAAEAYGLSREQYAHVLSTFSHTSYSKAPELCLAKFDELKAIGLEAFTKKYDPYWDIPLNENLPKPVIDLPGIQDSGVGSQATPRGPKRGSLNPESRIPNAASPVQLSFLTPDPGPLFRHPAEAAQPPTLDPRREQTTARRSEGLDPDTYELIKLLLEERGVITSGDAQDLTKLDAAGVRAYLQKLVEDGLAVTGGQRRGMKYRRVA